MFIFKAIVVMVFLWLIGIIGYAIFGMVSNYASMM